MATPYLLLPFTHGIDMNVLEYAVLLAKSRKATLVPLALVSKPRSGRVRLEHVQQSKDFLEAVQHISARYDVPVERFEVFTGDIVQSINIVADEMKCEAILIFVCDGDGILLQTREIKHLMEQATHNFYVIRLPSKGNRRFALPLPAWLTNWLAGKRRHLSVPG
jgi:hypothetical protein